MELTLRDLGPRRYAQMLLLRIFRIASYGNPQAHAQLVAQAREAGTGASETGKASSRSFFSDLWAGGLDLSPADQKRVLHAMTGIIAGFAGGFGGGFGGGFLVPAIVMFAIGQPVLGMIFLTLGVIGTAAGVLSPRLYLHHIANRPVSTGELESLAETNAGDSVETAYTRLLQDVLNYQPENDAAANRLREALLLLGEAIDRLPRAHSVRVDAGSLRDEVEQVRQKSAEEKDPVLAESYARRLAALEQSLRSVERSEQQVRRGLALREEMVTQINALRLSLHEQTPGVSDTFHLPGLAESVHSITRQAEAIASARAELDELPGYSASAASDGSGTGYPTVQAQPTEANTEDAAVLQVGHRR
ncbi:MAG: hypothetical protein OHK0029_03410 [Armatimonadaceae bacterium]